MIPLTPSAQRLFFLLGALFIVLVVITTFYPYGHLGFTYDSYDILGGSKDLHTYLTGKNPDGHSYLVRAPLHPFLLSFFQNKILAMWWINFISLILSLWLTFIICRLQSFSLQASLTVVVVLAMFVPWLVNFRYVWTEPLFILLILLLVYALTKNINPTWVLLICFALFLTRKSGLFFFVSTAVFYGFEKRWMQAMLFLILVVLTFLTLEWVEFTFQSTGYFPQWLPALQGYLRIYYLEAVTSWFLPIRVPLLVRTIILITALTMAFAFRRNEMLAEIQRRPNTVLLLVAGVYAIILIGFRGVSEYEDAERYLTVLFPLCLIFMASLLFRFLKISSRNVRMIILFSIGLWTLYTLLRLAHYFFRSPVESVIPNSF